MIHFSISLDEAITEELTNYIKAELPKLLNEYVFNDPAQLNKIIRSCMAGQLKAACVEVFQGKELREILTEKIIKELNG